MAQVEITYAQSFHLQLEEHFRYLATHLGENRASLALIGLLDRFEARVALHPASAPVCAEAATIGLRHYRDFVDTQTQLRVIYRLDDTEQEAWALLCLDTRQSIRQALIQYCLASD